jgi:hypothetical protein
VKIFDYDEAAEELRVTKTWLQRHIKELPRSKKGRRVTFTQEDLDRIEAQFHLEPEFGPLGRPVPVPVSPAGGHPLAHLKPLPARRKRTA